MEDIRDLVELRPVLGDGGMGTFLQERGLNMGESPEAWNLDRPDVIEEVHAAFAAAGSDYLETNTFGANPVKLHHYGLDAKLEEIITEGVRIAREAAGDSRLVAASIGPTGALLEPYGDLSEEEARNAFTLVARAFEAAGPDFYVIETMTDIREAALATEAVRALTGRPIIATMTFTRSPKGFRSVMGADPAEAARTLSGAGADYTGTNCVAGVKDAVEIIGAMQEGSSTALVAQPNAGLPEAEGSRVVYPETPEMMAEGIESLLEAGARIIGGCCGTTPAHIKALGVLMGRPQDPGPR
jgi:5-methyltetrahydrofolate--homocysteine methyltransferase